MSNNDPMLPSIVADFKSYASMVAKTDQAPDFMDQVPADDLVQALSMHLSTVAAFAAFRLADGFAKASALRDTYLATARMNIESALSILTSNRQLAAFLHDQLATAASHDLAA